MTEAFSSAAWQANAGLYQTILDMPFNRELAAGTLPQPVFQAYIIQDAHYLEGFARALALAAARAPVADHIVEFSGAAREAIVVERALHRDYFAKFGIGAGDFAAQEPSPVCEHYVSWLIKTGALAPYEVAVAALLPCFWIYAEVGKEIAATAAVDHPYRAWIDTYADPEFDAAVRRVIGIADAIAGETSTAVRTKMDQAFKRAAQLEYLFWDSAYARAGWPV